MSRRYERGFNVVELILVVVIVAVLFVLLSKDDKEGNVEAKENGEIPLYVKLWPFGPHGLICQHVVPAAYTSSEQGFLARLGGCYKNRNREDQKPKAAMNDEFVLAVSQGDKNEVSALIKSGVDINMALPSTEEVPAGTTPLMIAVPINPS